MRKVKIGMISFAHGHAISFLQQLVTMDDVQVTGISDEHLPRVQTYVERYDIPYYADYKELLATEADAVVICSETAFHARITIESARAGKHVLCEKPLGVSLEEMREMIRECRENGVQLMTVFPCRYSPAVVEAKRLVDRGAIGDIVAIKGANRGSLPPASWFTDKSLSGGGAVLDHTVHVMDLIHWFLDDDVVEVYAEVGTLFHDVDIDDAGMVHVQFSKGAIAVLDPSWSRAKSFPVGGDIVVEIIGTKGVLQVDALAQKNELYSDQVMKGQWKYWGDKMDALMINDFVKSIRDGLPVPITGEDGYKAAAVAIAAYESASLERPVRVN